MTSNEYVIDQREAMIKYANLTEDGKSVLIDAVKIIKDGNDIYLVDRIVDKSREMLAEIRAEYWKMKEAEAGTQDITAEVVHQANMELKRENENLKNDIAALLKQRTELLEKNDELFDRLTELRGECDNGSEQTDMPDDCSEGEIISDW